MISSFLLRTARRTSAVVALDSSLFYASRLQSGRTSSLLRWTPTPTSTRRLLTTKSKPGPSPKQPIENGGTDVVKAPFWNRFIGPKLMPERWTFAWYGEMVLICTVFAITGSSTMVLVRPAVAEGLGLKGSLKDGPWSYRICSLVVMTPIYATLLVIVGTVFGRHHYFRHFSVKMWSRFGIPPEMIDQSFHETKKHFRKW